MALIVRHHNIASQFNVDPVHDIATSPIEAGRLVRLDTNSYVQQAGVQTVVGLAGDSLVNSSGGTAFAADVVINGAGATVSTQNRVSDGFNETLASGKMTVYFGGGEFFTDQYVTSPVAGWATPGATLYSSATGLLTTDNGGSGRVVGYLVAGPAAYPSGVPGTDTTDGSLSLGTFVHFMLAL